MQVFFHLDDAGLPHLATIATDKAGKRHSPIRVDLAEKETIQREIENPAENSVTEIGLRHAVTMSKKDSLPLDFQYNFLMDLGANAFREKVSIRKVMIPLQQVDFAADSNKSPTMTKCEAFPLRDSTKRTKAFSRSGTAPGGFTPRCASEIK